MERKIIEETVYWEYFKEHPKWKDIKNKVEFQDDDLVQIAFEESYSGGGGEYFFGVVRNRPETDEEYEERINQNKQWEEEQREKRYQRYLKLKEEFENKKNS